MRRLMSLAIAASGLALALQAHAATTVLTFDGFACTGTDGGNVDRNCVNQNDYIGVDYGSSANLTVLFDAADQASIGGAPYKSLLYTYPGPTSGGAALGIGSGDDVFTRILLTPSAGFEVALNSFRYYKNFSTGLTFVAELLDSSNNTIFSYNGPSASGASYAPNTAYFSGPLTFRYMSVSGAPVIDDFTFDVRAVASPPNGAVPEPATWGMMLAGFGIVGAAMRRRSRRVLAIV
jgi:PEP-CTERM motif